MLLKVKLTQQRFASLGASLDILPVYLVEVLPDCSLDVERQIVRQALQSLPNEVVLDQGEAGLNRVRLGAVRYVEDGLDLQPLVHLPDDVVLVDRQVVEEEGERLSVVTMAESAEVPAEVDVVDRMVLDLQQLDSFLCRNGGYHRLVAKVHVVLVDAEVSVGPTPLEGLDRPLGEVDFIKPDQLEPAILDPLSFWSTISFHF